MSRVVVARQAFAEELTRLDNDAGSATPGGRLTLTTGVPVTKTDVTGATSIYYTPFVSDVVTLWNGTRWVPIQFAEYTLALGTLTSAKPYDVFAYINAGALALEVLVWTNGTTRATGVSIQGGRYCKTGDKTRLLIGTFYTTATTTTEDSVTKRFLWNAYNRRSKQVFRYNGSAHTYTTATYRPWNNDAPNSQIEFVTGLNEDTVNLGAFNTVSNTISNVIMGVGGALDVTNTTHTHPYNAFSQVTTVHVPQLGRITEQAAGPGYHFFCGIQYSDATGTSSWYEMSVMGEVLA